MDARLSDAVFSAPAAPTLGGPGPPAPVPAQPKPRTARVRVTSEVVGVRGALGGYYRSLPPWIDDLTKEFGPDTYDKMQLDDQVSSSLRALCHGVLSDELVLRPGVDDKDDPDFAAAKDVLAFCERATWGQTGGLDRWLLTMLKGAVGGGNRVSETVYRPEESGRDVGRWVPDRLKVKPRRSVAFAVDGYNNLAGILGLPPGGAGYGFGGTGWGGLAWGTTFDPADPPENFLPRDKFCVLSWDPPDEDPRGSALLRCVYEPWWAKLQAAREWLAYLAQFGSPSLVGTTAPGADSTQPTDAYGNPTGDPVLTPEQDMANQVVALRNGGVFILPSGATLDVLQTSNAGDAFLKKVDSCDRAIAQGINLAMRAVMQSRFGSRADAEQGQDVAGLQTRFMKRWLARMVTEDLLRRGIVGINYGPDAARRLCPYASLSPVEHQDLGTALVAMTGAWKAGFLKPSQLPWAYEQFGMPPATPEELKPPPPQPVAGQPTAPGGPGEPPPAGPPAPPPEPPAPPGPPDLGFSDPEGGGLTPPSAGPPQPPAGFPAPWRRVRPDGWEEVYDPDSGQWVAGDQLDLGDLGEDDAGFAVWDESQHTRGQPENAGQFGPGGYGGGQAGVATAAPPAPAADPRERRRQKAGERRAADRARREAEVAERLTRPPLVFSDDAARAQPALDRLFPEGFPGKDAGALVGAPNGSVLTVAPNEYTGGLSIGLGHPHVDYCDRALGRDRSGELVMSNRMFFLKKPFRGSGLGLQVFSEEVRALAALGVDRIETCAGKGGIMNGYYTWPRLGYDAPLDDGTVTAGRAFRLFRDGGASIDDADRRANALVASAPETVQDLMATPDGRAYWKKHGRMGGMTFDLKPGSRSLAVLNDYLASKGKPGIEVDAVKVDALKARREEARKAADQRRRGVAVTEKFKQDREAMNSARAYWRGQAAKAGIGGDLLDGKAGAVERRMIAEREADPDAVWGVGLDKPGALRFDAYRQAGADLVDARHAERMADPSLADVRGHYEREAESRGLDPARVRAVAAETAYASPDAVYAVGRAYATAIDALSREKAGGTAPFAFDPAEPRVPAGSPEGGEWGPGGGGHPLLEGALSSPRTLPQLTKFTGIPKAELLDHLRALTRAGRLEHGVNARGTPTYRITAPAPVPGAAPHPFPVPSPIGKEQGTGGGPAPTGGLPRRPSGAVDALHLIAHERYSYSQAVPVAEIAHALGVPEADALRQLHAARGEGVSVSPGRDGRPTAFLGKGPGGLSRLRPEPTTATPARQAAVKSGLEGALAGVPAGRLVPIHELRAKVPAPDKAAFDDAARTLWREGRVRMVSLADLQKATVAQLDASIPGTNETFFYLEPTASAHFSWEDQPRVPAGGAGGGEWGSGGGGTAVAGKPPGKKPRVVVGLTDREEAAVAKIVKGPLKIKGGLTGEQMAALGGAPEDGQATVRPGKDGKSLQIHVSNDFTAVRHLRRLGSGELVMENESIKVKESEQGKGLGTEAFARQVDAARALGVGSIRCHAARYDAQGREAFNGYSTWPKLGYDQDFEDLEVQGPAAAGVAAAARAAFPGVESVLQLMAVPGGKHWWAKNGTDLRRAKFDLSDGSDSVLVLEAYLEARKEDAARG